MGRHVRRGILVVLALLIAAVSIGVGLVVTPDQQVATAGQTIEVGVSAPTLDLSGPGELDLFGQRLDTTVEFAGPVRPRIRLTHITLSQQLRDFTSGGGDSAASLSSALVDGFRRYIYWEIAVVGVVAVLIAGAVTGWLRRGWRASLVFIALVLVVTEAINVGAIMSTAYTAPDKLGDVRSLQALVGDAPELRVPAKQPRDDVAGRVVVIGDSTAAGIGNSPLPDPTPDDEACHRSSDAFAVALANVGTAPVTNLACSGATIRAGLLGPQAAGSRTVPAQLSSRALADAATVVVSVGANDVRWSDQLLVCAVSVSCQNNAEQAAFQQDLSAFSVDYLELLSALQQLPTQPEVVIDLYYDPFAGDIDCLADLGVTAEKQEAMLSKLTAINEILRSGAEAASFRTAEPNFDGHGLCGATPFVQGVDDPAPFHPTPGGEVAIALAVERALRAD
ncbi:GDSL-type esterase/lipase family protein [Nocardioides mangrovi]|uniref:GDSL-type esterase/lipase family protein n=1 Tax=Nocardioides mangrovi TaxID=2874580 RepID=A0ABS7U808_9ACTN|nr:GDSL-type esterase/lipase family protein [Nocardioides mangrovi]MBZ5737109.1 GDSL-type esterase/lipase family protein [Nocardioides mangrovi]